MAERYLPNRSDNKPPKENSQEDDKKKEATN